MKAVILCGGTGSRLRPLTEVKPKPLLKLVNVPVIENIIRSLEKNGIRDIYISLGYMAQEIIRACEQIDCNARLHYFEEAKPLGTAGGVKNCLEETSDTVLVVSGDNIFDIKIDDALKFHNGNSSDFTVICKTVCDPRAYGCVNRNDKNEILSFTEKPDWENADTSLINTGIYIFNGDILSLIPGDTFYDFAENLFPLLISEKKKFLCFETDGFWGDMGEFSSFAELSGEVMKNHNTSFLIGGTLLLHDETDKNGNSFKAPCVIGKNVTTGSYNKIGPNAVIGDNVIIGNGCTIVNSTIGEDSKIENSTDLTDVITDEKVTIASNCVIEKNAVIGYGCKIGKFSRIMAGVKIWPGKTVKSESVINENLFYETPVSPEFDIFGISGKVYSQLTLSDAVKIAQAFASRKNIRRIGVASDGKNSSSVYGGIICNGIQSCGVACYDFDETFLSQVYFYSSYCSLDGYIYISTQDDTVNLSFFGENGMPVSSKQARSINNNYRFSSFSFVSAAKTGILYKMSPLAVAYKSSLQKTLQTDGLDYNIIAECDNPFLKNFIDDFLSNVSDCKSEKILQILFNPYGTDLYCIENDVFYSSDRIRCALCELEFASGNDVIINENASAKTERTAEKYNKKAIRVFEGDFNPKDISPDMIKENLWNFDALHLCAKIINLMSITKMSLRDICSINNDFSIRSKIFELNCEPSEIRNRLLSVAASKKDKKEVYYNIDIQSGSAKIRQLGNTNRVKMLVEAADMETAKEIMGNITSKFVSHSN